MCAVPCLQNGLDAVNILLDGVLDGIGERILYPAAAYRCYDERWVLNNLSYGDLMEDLGTAWRRTDAPEEAPSIVRKL